jgi:hypothetical protein
MSMKLKVFFKLFEQVSSLNFTLYLQIWWVCMYVCIIFYYYYWWGGTESLGIY